MEGESDIDCGEPNIDPKLWCSCWGCDDGRLMINCDRHGENYNVWYHYDCLRLTMEEGQRIGASGEEFLFVPPVTLYRMIHMMHHFLWIPLLLNPCTNFQWGELVDRYFVTSYYLHTYEKAVCLVPLGRLGGVLCLNLLDCIKLL